MPYSYGITTGVTVTGKTLQEVSEITCKELHKTATIYQKTDKVDIR